MQLNIKNIFVDVFVLYIQYAGMFYDKKAAMIYTCFLFFQVRTQQVSDIVLNI